MNMDRFHGIEPTENIRCQVNCDCDVTREKDLTECEDCGLLHCEEHPCSCPKHGPDCDCGKCLVDKERDEWEDDAECWCFQTDADVFDARFCPTHGK